MPRDDEDKRSLSPLILDDSLSSSSYLDSPRFSPVRFTSKRRRIVVAAVAVFSIFSLLGLVYLSSSRPLLVSQDPVPALPFNRTPSLDRKSALLGPPTSRFRGSPQGYSSSVPSSRHCSFFFQTIFVMTRNTLHLGSPLDGVSTPHIGSFVRSRLSSQRCHDIRGFPLLPFASGFT